MIPEEPFCVSVSATNEGVDWALQWLPEGGEVVAGVDRAPSTTLAARDMDVGELDRGRGAPLGPQADAIVADETEAVPEPTDAAVRSEVDDLRARRDQVDQLAEIRWVDTTPVVPASTPIAAQPANADATDGNPQPTRSQASVQQQPARSQTP